VLAEEETQIVGVVPTDEPTSVKFEVAAGELTCMAVAAAAALVPEVMEVDRKS
jgi:hypothetical protein